MAPSVAVPNTGRRVVPGSLFFRSFLDEFPVRHEQVPKKFILAFFYWYRCFFVCFISRIALLLYSVKVTKHGSPLLRADARFVCSFFVSCALLLRFGICFL